MSILFKGNLKEGDYKLIKTTNGWVLDGEIAYVGVERPRGEWILQDNQHHIEKIYLCSNCENFEAWGESEKYNYCPNCGARMKGADDD